MMWIAGAIVVSAIILGAFALVMFRQYIAAQQHELLGDEEPQLEEDLVAADDRDAKHFDAERFRSMLRDGPRGMEERHRQEWHADKRRHGFTNEDIQVLLDTREPIVRL